jgi:hypothetical protein
MKNVCILVSVSAMKSEVMVLNCACQELFVIDCYIKWLFRKECFRYCSFNRPEIMRETRKTTVRQRVK